MRRFGWFAVAVAALGSAACRSPSDDLRGTWAGRMDCDADGLVYTTDAVLVLEAPSEGRRHDGTLDLESAWTDADGVGWVQTTAWTVAVFQEFAKGSQDVDFVRSTCSAAQRVGDDGTALESCPEVASGIGTSSLYWDGADSLAWGGDCDGALTRGGEIPADDTGAADPR